MGPPAVGAFQVKDTEPSESAAVKPETCPGAWSGVLVAVAVGVSVGATVQDCRQCQCCLRFHGWFEYEFFKTVSTLGLDFWQSAKASSAVEAVLSSTYS